MTPLQNKLRAALRETADEIPARGAPAAPEPPAAAPARARPERQVARLGRAAGRRGPGPRAVAASLAVAGSLKHQPAAAGPQASPDGVPAYYVALTTANPYPTGTCSTPPPRRHSAAELRSTPTGAVLAKITPPKPYVSFTGVTAAADDRTFVLPRRARHPPPSLPPFPAQRFFLLRIDPAARTAPG